jgi:hypothetical protein
MAIRMRSILACLLLYVLVGAGFATPSHAQEAAVAGETVVPDRTDAARAAALPAALADALRRLSPDAEAADRIDAAAVLTNDSLLLQRFEYQQVMRPTASGIPSIKLMLRAWFHAAPARAVLVRAGVPVWRGGEVAPTLWLVDESDDGLRLLEQRADPALTTFADALTRRGVRVLWAPNDLDDWRMAEALTSDNAASSLADAASRVSADPAVLAWIRHDEEGVSVDWFVRGGASENRLSSSGVDLASALDGGIPRLLALLAEESAVAPGAVTASAREIDRGAGDYVMWLENLGRAGAYAEAISLIQGQAIVGSVTPEQASADRVRLRVRLTEPLAQLLALLAADGRLTLSTTPPGDADLTLRWND